MTFPHAACAAPLPGPDHPRERVRGLDILRGVVILLMVIDHVRWFLSDARFDPTDRGRTSHRAGPPSLNHV